MEQSAARSIQAPESAAEKFSYRDIDRMFKRREDNADLADFPYEKLGVEPTREPVYRSIHDRAKPKERKPKASRIGRSASNASSISVEVKPAPLSTGKSEPTKVAS